MKNVASAVRRWWQRYVHTDPREMSRPQIAAFLFSGALLSFGASAAVILVAGPLAALHVLESAHWRWLLLAPLGIAVSHAGYTFAYREVARAGGGPDLARGDAAVLVTTGFGALNPRGGFGLDKTSLENFGLERDEARQRVLVLGMVEYAVLAPAAFAAALIMLLHHQRAQAGLLPSWIIGFPVGAAVAIGLLLARRLAAGPGDRSWRRHSRRDDRTDRNRVWRFVDRGLDSVQLTLSFLGSWTGVLALVGMAVYWAGEILVLWACLAVFAPGRGSLAAVIVGYATGYALTRRTLPLAGAGAVEALLPFALLWVSYPLAVAAVAVVAYRLFNLWLTVIPAGAGLRQLRRRWRSADAHVGHKKRGASTVTSS